MAQGSQPNSGAAQSLTISSRTRPRSATVTTTLTVGRLVTGRQGATSRPSEPGRLAHVLAPAERPRDKGCIAPAVAVSPQRRALADHVAATLGANRTRRGPRSATPRVVSGERTPRSRGERASVFVQVGRVGFEPTKAEPADLQSAPVVRLGTDPRARRRYRIPNGSRNPLHE